LQEIQIKCHEKGRLKVKKDKNFFGNQEINDKNLKTIEET